MRFKGFFARKSGDLTKESGLPLIRQSKLAKFWGIDFLLQITIAMVCMHPEIAQINILCVIFQMI